MFTSSKTFIVEYKEGDYSLHRTPFSSIQQDTDLVHIVADNESLLDIAHKYYRDDYKWFIIADFNDIVDPWEISIGDKLVIPTDNEY